MKAYNYDGSFEGLLCCIYRAFTEKEHPFAVYSDDFQPSFDTQITEIKTDPDIAARVAAGIRKNCSISLLSTISYVMRSGDGLKSTIVFNAVKKCLEARKDLTMNYADYDMLAFSDIKERISYEIHRMKGFLRFEECEGGGLYAHFSPDNDICDLLAPHFKSRYPNERFIIHDIKRNKMSLYDGKEIHNISLSTPVTMFLSGEEKNFQSLWKTYFNSVNIKERKHTRLQDHYLPRRYRKNMSEFL